MYVCLRYCYSDVMDKADAGDVGMRLNGICKYSRTFCAKLQAKLLTVSVTYANYSAFDGFAPSLHQV